MTKYQIEKLAREFRLHQDALWHSPFSHPISKPIRESLRAVGYVNWSDLSELTLDDLLKIDGIGITRIKALIRFLMLHNLLDRTKFGQEFEQGLDNERMSPKRQIKVNEWDWEQEHHLF